MPVSRAADHGQAAAPVGNRAGAPHLRSEYNLWRYLCSAHRCAARHHWQTSHRRESCSESGCIWLPGWASRGESGGGLRRDSERFEHWLAEWKDHTWSLRSTDGWSRLQVADSAVQERTRQVLSTTATDGLDRLSVVVEVVAEQRHYQDCCRTRIGVELSELKEAGGTWQEIADWTTMDERTVRSVARTSSSGADPASSRIDAELTTLVARVPANPFFRIYELLTASRFVEAVANELEDVTDWLCFELSTSGVERSYIARHAHINQLTLARRINRAKRGRRSSSVRRSSS